MFDGNFDMRAGTGASQRPNAANATSGSSGCRDGAGERLGAYGGHCWSNLKMTGKILQIVIDQVPAEMNQTFLPIRLHILRIPVRSIGIEIICSRPAETDCLSGYFLHGQGGK